MLQVFASILSLALLGYCSGLQASESESQDCGRDCLFVGLRAIGINTSLEAVSKRLGKPPEDGYSLMELGNVATSFGAQTLALNTDLRSLQSRKSRTQPFACICLVSGNHYVLCSDVTADTVCVVDPPVEKKFDHASFLARWNGDVLLLSRSSLDTNTGSAGWIWVIVFAGVAIASFVAIRLRRRHLAMMAAITAISLGDYAFAMESPKREPTELQIHLSDCQKK